MVLVRRLPAAMATHLRAGPTRLNSPMRVDTSPEGEDTARENWSNHYQKTTPHTLSGIQGEGGAGRSAVDHVASPKIASVRRDASDDGFDRSRLPTA
jgi:hypothetical protein